MQKPKRNTRKVKEAINEKPPVKDKFLETLRSEDQYLLKQAIPKFQAVTNNQKKTLAIYKSGCSVVFLTGAAGTGKSMLAAYEAACHLKQKTVDKVYLVRPAVAVGKSIGLLPGEINEKMLPYFAQTLAHLEKFMGHGFLNYCLDKDIIEMKPAEYLRGMSFENAIVIVEESQNFNAEEFQMVLTRLGNNCKIIFTGDVKQHDLSGESGLSKTVALFKKMAMDAPEYLSEEDLAHIIDNIGIVEFTIDDVVRSGLTKAFVKVYHNN